MGDQEHSHTEDRDQHGIEFGEQLQKRPPQATSTLLWESR
jgi:hypothetical protein